MLTGEKTFLSIRGNYAGLRERSKPAQIRYKPKAGGKNIKCHLLNGSGVALPRLMLALEGKELPI